MILHQIDMGINLEYDITSLMIPFDNVGILHDGLFDSGILGAKAGDPWWKDWLNFLDNREYKNLDRKKFRTAVEQMPLTGSHTQMTFLDIRYSDRKVLFLEDGFYIRMRRMGSWYKALEKSKIDLWEI